VGVLVSRSAIRAVPAAVALIVVMLVAAPRAGAVLFYDSQWGGLGTGNGQFDGPEGVGIAPSGDVYVADTANDRIQHFDSLGNFIGKWGLTGNQTGQFNRPLGVTVDQAGNVYVADSGNNRVQKFGPTGAFMQIFGGDIPIPGIVRTPSDVAVDAVGNVYIADTGNNRVSKYSSSGNALQFWGQQGTSDGRFNQPLGIVLDLAGNAYVTDGGNNRVQKFDLNGTFLTKWGTPGTGNGQFNTPYGIAIDSSGDVYVADNANHRIQRFSPAGAFIVSSGSLGSGNGELRFPSGLDIGASDRVYVADTVNNRIQRFITANGGIIAVKDSIPDDPEDFTFTTGGGLSPTTFALDDDGNDNNGTSNAQGFVAEPGSGYSLSEIPLSGWDLTSSTCSDGSDPSNIDVSQEEVVTCTFTNRKRGRIIVVQDSLPNDPQDFSFTVGGGSSPSSFQLDDDSNGTLPNTQVIANVVPGSGHSVSQTTPAGWGTAQTSCSDGSPVSNIDVAPGETVTCTFSNLSDNAGRIVVVKDADPDDVQDFPFTAGGGISPTGFSLDDDGLNNNALSNTREFIVSTGSGYSLSEGAVAGWFLASATCSDGSPVSNIAVSPGETVTCTFLNRRAGRLVVVKDARPDDEQLFDFMVTGPDSPPAFELEDDGQGLGNTQTLASLTPGSYSITETVPSGWVQASATCSDGSPVTNVDVASGETVTCTFTNDKQASIVVVKDSQPDDPQDFSFTAGGGLSPSSFQLDDDGDQSNGLARSRTFSNLTPGSGYSISEAPEPGWDRTASCSDGSPPSNIGLSLGEVVTCTFTNRRHGSITLNLDTQPDDPQDFSFTTTGGLSPSSFTLDDDGDNGNELSNTISFPDVSPGQYSIDQDPVAGWVQEDASCSNGSQLAEIDLAPGENITCTVVVSHRSKIVVVKDARPDSSEDFDFTTLGMTPAFFQLDDDANEQNALPSRRSFIVDPGSGYSVQEQGPSTGWTLDQSCSDGSPTSNIDVLAGETVTCTFINTAAAYPRPKSASPIRMPLVPAYAPCLSGNRVHGPPLAFPSCNPPANESTSLTVGSPDANGAAANSTGFVKLKTMVGIPGGSDDADVAITGSVTDIRCLPGTTPCPTANVADGADYAGDLRVELRLRITDRGAGDIPATVSDFAFSAQMPCVSTTSTSIGGTCTISTTADSVIPGAVPESQRAIWAVDQIQVWDGGADGNVQTTSGDEVFLRQGVFSP
jgi:DNA-binding beta-propeller fold protein YncE